MPGRKQQIMSSILWITFIILIIVINQWQSDLLTNPNSNRQLTTLVVVALDDDGHKDIQQFSPSKNRLLQSNKTTLPAYLALCQV
jgi:hypothetical protein